MSRLIDFQNRIRGHLQPNWLSVSQLYTYNRIQQLFSFQDTVNLYGASGTGKTFLTWVLSQEIEADFYAYSEKLEREKTQRSAGGSSGCCFEQAQSAMIAVVDPHPGTRAEVRQTLSALHELGCKKILLVSHEPVADQIPGCLLVLNDSDIVKIYHNWDEVLIPVDDLPESFQSLNLHLALRTLALGTLAITDRDSS